MELAFTKLFNTIITSTIWQEDDQTRIVWITMLAIANAQGRVAAALPGLASIAHVSLEDAQKAITTLEGPDTWSRTKEFDGRRIEPIDGGWQILNYQKYRTLRNEEERRAYKAEWIKKRRQKRRQKSTNVDKSRPKSSQAEAEAEAEAEADKKLTNVSFLDSLKKDSFFTGVDINQELIKAKRWCKTKNRRCTERFFRKWCERADRIIPDPIPKSTSAYVGADDPLHQESTEEQRQHQKIIISQQVKELAQQFRMQP